MPWWSLPNAEVIITQPHVEVIVTQPNPEVIITPCDGKVSPLWSWLWLLPIVEVAVTQCGGNFYPLWSWRWPLCTVKVIFTECGGDFYPMSSTTWSHQKGYYLPSFFSCCWQFTVRCLLFLLYKWEPKVYNRNGAGFFHFSEYIRIPLKTPPHEDGLKWGLSLGRSK